MPGMLARRMPIYGARKRLQERVLRETHEVKSSTAVPDYGTRGRLIGHYAASGGRAVPKDNARRRYSGRSPPLRIFDMLRPYGVRETDGTLPSGHESQKSRRGRRRYERQQRTSTAKTRCRAEARRYENLCARATLANRAAPRRAIAEQAIRGQNMWSIQIWREGKPSSAEMPRRKVRKD